MILFLGFKLGSNGWCIFCLMRQNEMYDSQIPNDLGFKVRENLQLTNTQETTTCFPSLKAWQHSSILAKGKIVQAVILPYMAK